LVPLEIIEFVDSSGRSPFRHWFDNLDATAAARVTAALARLALGSWSHVKSVGEGLQELRLDVGPGYRVYFGVPGESGCNCSDAETLGESDGIDARIPADGAGARSA
jgi:putative addiction module killer protein